MSVPVLPIREMWFRMDKKSGRFVPCSRDDSRWSLVTNVDATGRDVMAVTLSFIGDNRIIGWKRSPGADSPSSLSCDPETVVAWMQKNPELKLISKEKS